VSSFEPSEGANQLQSRREIARGLFVASGDATELFDELEESLDQIAFGVEGEIPISFDLAIGLWRDDRLDRARPQAGDVGVGVVALVSQDRFGLYLCGQCLSLGDIVDLASGQSERERVSECVDDQMDFRGQAAARTTYGLVDALLLTRPDAVLMRSDDGGVDHGVLVIGIIRDRFEKTLPNPFDRPARETGVNVLPGPEPLWHVAQGTPVRNFQVTASTKSLLPSSLSRPTYPGRPGSISSIRAYWSSCNPWRFIWKPPKDAPHESCF
jgi:hypothetical protein